MKKKYLRVLSISLLSSLALTACNANKYKVTFVSEGNSDIVRYVDKGKTLVDIPDTPQVKGKYCLWDRDDFHNINEDITVTANCYSSVSELKLNVPSSIDVEVSSFEADLDYIFKDLEVEATFESGEKKKIYKGEYTIEANDYNKDVGGSYSVGIAYNNAKKNITINVNKISNYVTAYIDGEFGYYNEGLPRLGANTNVEGNIYFDEGQTLYIGTKAYTWTFMPTNTDKYAIEHGSIDVTLLNASELTTNSDSLNVDFGTSKAQIIELIKEELLIRARYGNDYKEIDAKYYTIDSSDFVDNKSGTFTFRISYNNSPSIYVDISINVDKCKDYSLVVNDVEEFIINEHTSLNDVLLVIEKTSDIEGTLSFASNQVLGIGNLEYNYIFTPNNANYAIKEGKVRIHGYRAQRIEFTSKDSFAYGSDKETVLAQLKENATGTIYYNEGLTKEVDKNNVTVTLDETYNSLQAKVYGYTINYNSEIESEETFTLEKCILQDEVDFQIHVDEVDLSNSQIMPHAYITRKDDSKFDFDPSLFTLVQIPDSEVQEQGQIYTYQAELIPDESISDNFARVQVSVMAFHR